MGWESPSLLLFGAILLILTGGISLAVGRRSIRWARWVIAAALAALFGCVIYNWSLLAQAGFAPHLWDRGWILPRDEGLALKIGVSRDPLSLLAAALVTLGGAYLLALAPAFGRGARADRLAAALAISTGSTVLAWCAGTPWLAMMGWVGASVGAFLFFGALEGDENESRVASRLLWERVSGVLLALLGLGVLSIQAHAEADSLSRAFGEGLVFLGLVAQLHVFPFAGGLARPSRASVFFSTAIGQVFPAWAASALLIRFLPMLSGSVALPALAWFGVAAAFVSALIGLFAGATRGGLSAWIAAVFSLCLAVTAQAGARAGMGPWLSAGLGALAFAALAEPAPATHQGAGPGWARAGLLLAAAALTGFFGFAGAGGWLAAVLASWTAAFPAWGAAFCFALSTVVFLGATVLIRTWRGAQSPRPWSTALLPYLPALLALGLVWDGTPSGGALPGVPERVMLSLLDLALKAGTALPGAEENLAASEGMLWGSFAFALLLGLWFAASRRASLEALPDRFPRFGGWLSRGLGADAAARGIVSASAWSGARITRFNDERIWNEWVPLGLSRGIRLLSAGVARLDTAVAWWIGGMLRPVIEWPSRALQWVQSGDVQWYIGVALVSLLALIAAFMTHGY